MSKTLIGVSTYGNLPFTKLTVDEIYKTTTRPYDLAIVVGKPGDQETVDWAIEMRSKTGLHFAVHAVNLGFSGSINDIYDFAFRNGYDQVIFVGNDVIAYPGCIDGMIDLADTTEWEMICASMLDVKSLCALNPEAREYFRGETYEFTDFTARPWDLHKDFRTPSIEPDTLKDVRNMTLFKRSAFYKIGYADINFWPNAYFEDNDTARRANLAGVKACGAPHCPFFHFWSRTIHQGESRHHSVYFDRNKEFYQLKWGGPVGAERFTLPFDGRPHELKPGLPLPAMLRIGDRLNECAIVDHWRSR